MLSHASSLLAAADSVVTHRLSVCLPVCLSVHLSVSVFVCLCQTRSVVMCRVNLQRGLENELRSIVTMLAKPPGKV